MALSSQNKSDIDNSRTADSVSNVNDNNDSEFDYSEWEIKDDEENEILEKKESCESEIKDNKFLEDLESNLDGEITTKNVKDLYEQIINQLNVKFQNNNPKQIRRKLRLDLSDYFEAFRFNGINIEDKRKKWDEAHSFVKEKAKFNEFYLLIKKDISESNYTTAIFYSEISNKILQFDKTEESKNYSKDEKSDSNCKHKSQFNLIDILSQEDKMATEENKEVYRVLIKSIKAIKSWKDWPNIVKEIVMDWIWK